MQFFKALQLGISGGCGSILHLDRFPLSIDRCRVNSCGENASTPFVYSCNVFSKKEMT